MTKRNTPESTDSIKDEVLFGFYPEGSQIEDDSLIRRVGQGIWGLITFPNDVWNARTGKNRHNTYR